MLYLLSPVSLETTTLSGLCVGVHTNTHMGESLKAFPIVVICFLKRFMFHEYSSLVIDTTHCLECFQRTGFKYPYLVDFALYLILLRRFENFCFCGPEHSYARRGHVSIIRTHFFAFRFMESTSCLFSNSLHSNLHQVKDSKLPLSNSPFLPCSSYVGGQKQTAQ